MIRREDVADLRAGDVVEYTCNSTSPGVTLSLRGPLTERRGSLYVGGIAVRRGDGEVLSERAEATLTVISRAPRPLYVNSDRTEPMAGDVVRNADDENDTRVWLYADTSSDLAWAKAPDHEARYEFWASRLTLPARLRLLVDGETGRVVP